MKKKVGIIKRVFCIGLIFLISINSFAAVVSDNDGSAFITKAEFDSLKNNFQAQIDQYNQSIDAKIDGAIAQYLAGIKITDDHLEVDWIIPDFKEGSFGMYNGKYIDFYFSPRHYKGANSTIVPYFSPNPLSSSTDLYINSAILHFDNYSWSTVNYAPVGSAAGAAARTVAGDCNDGFVMPIFGTGSSGEPYGVYSYMTADPVSRYLDGVPGQSDLTIYQASGWKGMTLGQARTKKYFEKSWTEAAGYDVVVHYPSDLEKNTSSNYYWCPLIRATGGSGEIQFKYIPTTAEAKGWHNSIIDISTEGTGQTNPFGTGAVSYIARREPDGTLTNICEPGNTNIWLQSEKTNWTVCNTVLNAGDEIVCILKPKTPSKDTTCVGRLGMYFTNLSP